MGNSGSVGAESLLRGCGLVSTTDQNPSMKDRKDTLETVGFSKKLAVLSKADIRRGKNGMDKDKTTALFIYRFRP